MFLCFLRRGFIPDSFPQLRQVTGAARHVSLAAVSAPVAAAAEDKASAAQHLTPNQRLRQKLLQRIHQIESRMAQRLHEA